MARQQQEISTLRDELQEYKVQASAHKAVASDYHRQGAELERMRQRNIQLDSTLEDIREENARLKHENSLLSAGRSWGDRAECQAEAEASQSRPPQPAPQAKAPLPQQPEASQPVAGPSTSQDLAGEVRAALMPGLQLNVAQIVEDALRQQREVQERQREAQESRFAKLELRLMQQSTQPPPPTPSHGPIQMPMDH